MEVIVYAAGTACLWLASSTVLLPFVLLLRFHKPSRDRWFSFLYERFIAALLLRPNRERAFKLLEQHLSDRDKSVPLKILEIGIGSGANLKFYPENSRLTALDMNASFLEYFHKYKKKHPEVNYEETVISMAENMAEVADSSMDVVVSTFVMCSVEDINKVLKEVKRVLKSGGKFLFLEHVAFDTDEWSYTIQRFIKPLWNIYCDGCCPDRDIETSINLAGFSDVSCEKMLVPKLLLFIRPQIVGIATN